MSYFNKPAPRPYVQAPIVTDGGYASKGVRKHAPLSYAEHKRHFWNKFMKAKKQEGFVIIKLTDNDVAYANAFAKKVVEKKMLEEHHQKDSRWEIERWMVGTLGEIALGKFLGIDIHDPSIGDSSYYAVPDLKDAIGVRCGVKSFRFQNFPLTNRVLNYNGYTKRDAYPQIFLSISLEYNVAYLFGLATVEQMAENERDEENRKFVKDENALVRKTAFTAIDELHKFKDVESLKALLSGNRGLKSS